MIKRYATIFTVRDMCLMVLVGVILGAGITAAVYQMRAEPTGLVFRSSDELRGTHDAAPAMIGGTGVPITMPEATSSFIPVIVSPPTLLVGTIYPAGVGPGGGSWKCPEHPAVDWRGTCVIDGNHVSPECNK